MKTSSTKQSFNFLEANFLGLRIFPFFWEEAIDIREDGSRHQTKLKLTQAENYAKANGVSLEQDVVQDILKGGKLTI